MINKSTVGMSNTYMAKHASSGSKEGFRVHGTIKADFSLEYNEAKLYGDNAVLHERTSFKSGTISFSAATFTEDETVYMLGHTKELISGDQYKIVSKTTDIAPYLEFGFLADSVDYADGDYTDGYTAVWLYKVKFREDNSSVQTKGDSTQYMSPAMTGRIFETSDGVYREMATFATKAEAVNWLETMADLSDNVATPAADVASGRYTASQTVTLTCATTGATIKYSIDGGTESTYSAALTVSATSVLRFHAEKTGMNNSPTVTMIYEIA